MERPLARFLVVCCLIVALWVSWSVINDGAVIQRMILFSSRPVLRVFPPANFKDPPLPQGHPCRSFPNPSRAPCWLCNCPVCYVPVDQALKALPLQGIFPELVLSTLTYLHRAGSTNSTPFGGNFSLEERERSFKIRESMAIPCGFARAGVEPGREGSGFEIQEEADMDYLRECRGIVVASAIFGNYDVLKPPANLSSTSARTVCFAMFVDDKTLESLQVEGTPAGAWRIILVRSDAYEGDNRSKGEIPKMLLHRLVPNARFSIWIDAKLQMVADPIQILERFLWRSGDTMAISNHFERADAFEEAEATIRYRRYESKAKMDAQMEFYRTHDGLLPYDRAARMPLVSDVPDSCAVLREHTPLTNLFSCLWFNELDRFTPRDQVSFAVVRDKIIAQVPWRINMFEDCEKRNFVWETPHK
ncbi:uncharacterized protein LOC9633575 [Selaginella moellendorffii]|nr:uncharacterized protein LOC9633575 [Selaginella moellendorffii]|eukprot:XP_002960842.2 uncharacterized protein LOC9633575 [Selaginella moellendorffii]